MSCSIINISINTHEIHKCPRGEIGRHKGLKILAACGASSSLAGAPLMSKLQIVSDKNKKSLKIKNLLLKKIKSYFFKNKNLTIVIGGDGYASSFKKIKIQIDSLWN